MGSALSPQHRSAHAVQGSSAQGASRGACSILWAASLQAWQSHGADSMTQLPANTGNDVISVQGAVLGHSHGRGEAAIYT